MKLSTTIAALAAILCLTLGFSSLALAEDGNKRKTIGEIVQIEEAQQTFEINDQNGKGMVFKVTPDTDMEFEDNDLFSWSDDAELTDLKPGQWVKIKYYGTGEIKAAKKVKIYKTKER